MRVHMYVLLLWLDIEVQELLICREVGAGFLEVELLILSEI